MVRVLFYTSIISLLISSTFLFFNVTAVFVIISVLLLLLLLFLIFKHNNKFNYIFMFLICIIFCVVGIFNIKDTLKAQTELDGKTVVVEGYLTDDPVSYDTYCAYILNTEKISLKNSTDNIPQNLKIHITQKGDFAFTSFVKVKAKLKLKRVDGKLKGYSFSQGIFFTATKAKVISVTDMQTKPITYNANLVAKSINKSLYSNLGYKEASLASAVLLGDETGLSDKFYTQSKLTGVTHMLVVSGTHISIITLGIYTILEKIKFPKRLKPVLMLFVVFAIMAICGFSSSIVRAGFTFIVYFVGELFYKRSDGLNALGTATVILLFINPYLALDIGYLLSYVATYAVIALTKNFEVIFNKIYFRGLLGKIYRGSITIISQTLAATFATMPVCMIFFGYISIISVITNLLLATAVNGILIFSIFAVMLAPIPLINVFSFVFFFAITYLSKFTYFIVDLFSSLDFILFEVTTAHYIFWLILCLAIFIAFNIKKIKDFPFIYKTLKTFSVSLVAAAFLVVTIDYLKPKNYTRISFVNVGNGICTIIKHKDSTLLLGLGDNSTDHHKITENLLSMGVRQVDLAVVPHCNKAYCGGVVNSLKNLNIKKIVSSKNGAFFKGLSSYKNVTYFTGRYRGNIGEINFSINNGITTVYTPFIKIVFNDGPFVYKTDANMMVSLNYIPSLFKGDCIVVCGSEVKKQDIKNCYYIEDNIEFKAGEKYDN